MALLWLKWLATAMLGIFHPFYVSVTEINHNPKEQTLEVSCKMFSEDLEDILKKNYKTAVDLTAQKQQPQNEKMIQDYISKHLVIQANGKALKLNFIGFEKEAESVYCYFETEKINGVKKLDVTDSILQDFSDKQINIIHVMVNDNRKSQKLDYPDKLASFSF
jgi:hypothetical protein